jgi:diaminopimelate decarboxylase
MGHRKQTLVFEPGRFLTANSGVLLTRVINIKSNEDRHFAIIDAGMNDLIRPALYESWQRITAVTRHSAEQRTYDVVGPICETGDFLGKSRELSIEAGDLLAIHSAGAYGFAMSSNYNSRNRAAEVLVSGQLSQCVRDRETIDDQLRLEHTYQPT